MSLIPLRSELMPTRPRLFDSDLMSFRDDMDNLMNSFFTQRMPTLPRMANVGFIPAVDCQEKDDKYLLEVEVPGMTEDEIDIDLHDNTLTLKGERKSEFKEEEENFYYAERSRGSFRRDIPFNEEINADKVKANLRNGILHVELSKKEGGSKPHKKIKINH